MKLPNGDRADAPLGRLKDYVLNPAHAIGKHKARVFASALGLSADDAEALHAWLLEQAREADAEADLTDQCGARFVIRAEMRYKGKSALVRSVWIIRGEGAAPELLTALVE